MSRPAIVNAFIEDARRRRKRTFFRRAAEEAARLIDKDCLDAAT